MDPSLCKTAALIYHARTTSLELYGKPNKRNHTLATDRFYVCGKRNSKEVLVVFPVCLDFSSMQGSRWRLKCFFFFNPCKNCPIAALETLHAIWQPVTESDRKWKNE